LALAAPPAPSGGVQLKLDRRFELMSIVCRLAGFGEYSQGTIGDYNAALDAHFGPFKTHRAVLMLKELKKDGIAFDAVPHLAVRVKDAIDFAPTLPLDTAHGLDSRWKPGKAEAFLKAMADFARDTKAEAFFAAQAPFYERLLESCRKDLLPNLDHAWFLRTFGSLGQDTFTLGVAPLNGFGNFSALTPNSAGGVDRYAFIGTGPAPLSGQIPRFPKEFCLGTLVHEFLHGFANPWVMRHIAELKAAGEALNASVADEMRSQAYGTGDIALFESLVQAFTIRYFRELGQEDMARRQEQEQQRTGWYWVKGLAERLAEFGADRARYPQFEDFSPRLVAAFQEMGARAPQLSAAWREARKAETDPAALEARFAKGPKLVAMEPADGAQNVDPATTTIRFIFDRPMAPTIRITPKSPDQPEVLDAPAWDSEGKVITFKVRLRPGVTYRFGLNSGVALAFHGRTEDRNGNPLRPIDLGFSTRH
jgi:hypothetical protein